DSLNGIAFLDDRQVVEAHVSLHRGEPRLEIELEELR
ncbi:MAG: RusA family crossover junction endodeoxyribonuclease, partial [Selenomonadaceae bacterium]|nr:RusA family crossover junction endodeoxyribonuclease [Selenomonadaceae bacterium]